MSKAQLTAPLIAHDIDNRLFYSDDINGHEIERKRSVKEVQENK